MLSGSRKNVLVVNMDDVAFDGVSATVMPYLTSNPGGGWVDFTAGFVTTAICGPSRASLFTGVKASRHGANTNNDINSTFDAGINQSQMVQASLGRLGYRRAMFGKWQNGYPWQSNPLGYNYHPPFWDRWVAFTRPGDGSGNYFNFRVNIDGTEAPHNNADWSTDYVFAEAADWITSQATRPWFAYIAPKSPHGSSEATEVPARLQGIFDATPITKGYNFNPASAPGKPSWYPATPLETTDAVDASHRRAWEHMRGVDEGLQTVISAMSAAQLANTIIIVTGDNSNLFGEHRMTGKAVFYEEAVKVPFRIRVPGAANGTNPALISNEDIAPTLADIAGGAPPQASDGMSIARLLDGGGWRDNILLYQQLGSLAQDGHCIREARRKFTRYNNGFEEMYDLEADPGEMANLASTDTTKASEMRAKLTTLIAHQG